MRALTAIAAVVFVICIPVLLLTTNLRFAANSVRLYEYGFDKYNSVAATGLDREELVAFAGQMVTYFNSEEEYLDSGLLTQREIAHMKDVKGLIQLAYKLQYASLAYIILFAGASFALRRSAFRRDLARRLVWGSWTTIAFLIVVGIWAAVGFEELFLLFHLASFSNDLWQLSAGDNLLLMFPEGFFNEATLFVAGATVVEALLIGGLAWWFVGPRRKAGRSEAPVPSNEAGGAGAEP